MKQERTDHLSTFAGSGFGKVGDRRTMVGLSERWTGHRWLLGLDAKLSFDPLSAPCVPPENPYSPPLPPRPAIRSEITNKACTRSLPGRWHATAVTVAFICKWQMNQKSVWNFSSNFVCLLPKVGLGGSRLWLPTSPIHSNTDFFSGRF